MWTDLYLQQIRVAMGIHPAPSYANIYIARRLDHNIIEIGIKHCSNGKSAWLLIKRFLEGIIKLFVTK